MNSAKGDMMSQSDRSDSSQRRTVVEQGTEFTGKLSSTCAIDVHGKIQGEIATPALTVSATGAVHGSAKVGTVSSEGELSGEFDAERVELAGRVLDNTVIRARSLEVKLSSERGRLQVIFGECELAVGDEPAERDMVTAEVLAAEAAMPATTPAEASPEAPAEPELPAPPALAASSEDEPHAESDASPDLPSVAPEAQSPRAKSHRKNNGNGANADGVFQTSWSQPPSQPPPAS